ncbi:MAG: GGDEF domain-containing protein [Actinobacteria bacterium]|nr:GGDEF domain-containing protein [Actinomycetota bacterium]
MPDLAPPAREQQAFRRAAALAGAAVLLLGVCFFARLGGPHTQRTLSNVALFCAAFAAAIGCLVRSRRVTGRTRLSWLLIGAATASWGIGQVLWFWFESVLGDAVPFPSLADLGYLGMPVFTVLGLLVLGTAAQSAANRARSVLDGAMIATSLLLISWTLVLGPTIAAGADGLFALTISLSYPVSDVVMVTIVMYVLASRRQLHADIVPLILVGCGLSTFALSDSGFTYLTLTDAYSSGSPTDLGWFTGFLLILLASLRPERGVAHRSAVAKRARNFGLLMPYIAVVAAVLTTILDKLQGRGHGITGFISWDRSVLILLMVGRQVLTMLENRTLTRGLEARVAERTQELETSEQRFRALVLHSSDVVSVVDTDSVVQYQSESIERVFGHHAAQLVGVPLTSIFEPDAATALLEALASASLRSHGVAVIELPLVRADGRFCQAEISVTNLLDDPAVGALVLNMRDVTERRELENQLIHEAFHDTLTGLANRALFTDRVGQALQRRGGTDVRIAVLFLDLDGFKEINDSQGHAAGDAMLMEVACRLSDAVRAEDTVARLGGDEFAVLICCLSEDEENSARAVAERIRAALAAPFAIDNQPAILRASIGIAYADSGAEDAGQLLRNADLAMYRAKTAGEGGYVLYNPTMHADLVDKLQVAADLRVGLERGQFELYYQPEVDMAEGGIIGFEALIRWHHPERGLVAPDQFIPLAESTGLIRPLGQWVLEQACRQAAAWSQSMGRPIGMAVNVSSHQLGQHDFLAVVVNALAESGIEAGQLCLEMTESVLMNDTEDVLVLLNRLKGIGIRLAIDDFGTGYSSLSYLHRFPFDTLKIDRSFVERVTSPSGEATLARTIVQLGHGLGVTTVAEGLENQAQYEALRRIGCNVGQGFLISRPVPAEQATALLGTEPARPTEPAPVDLPPQRADRHPRARSKVPVA